MDIATVIGLLFGFGMIVGGFVLEGGNPMGLVQV
ncbi:MAG: motility protein A, partial [Chloroflexi bacterium]|nr:motility protein A [Chloroflexota bacterium]